MRTQQSGHLAPAPLSSPRGPPSTKTGGFALFGHTLGVRRDPQPPLCSHYFPCKHGKETLHPEIFCTHVRSPDKVLCVDRVMCCKERKLIKMNAVSWGGAFLCVWSSKKKCSLPLWICRVFVRLQELNPFAFHIYLHFQGTTVSVATLICLFALQQVLLWFILYHFFTELPAVAAHGLSPETCAFNNQFFKL